MDSPEFVVNQTLAVTEAVTTANFKLWYVQTQQHEAVVLENALQHCADLDNKITRQSGRGREKGGILLLVLQ